MHAQAHALVLFEWSNRLLSIYILWWVGPWSGWAKPVRGEEGNRNFIIMCYNRNWSLWLYSVIAEAPCIVFAHSCACFERCYCGNGALIWLKIRHCFIQNSWLMYVCCVYLHWWCSVLWPHCPHMSWASFVLDISGCWALPLDLK